MNAERPEVTRGNCSVPQNKCRIGRRLRMILNLARDSRELLAHWRGIRPIHTADAGLRRDGVLDLFEQSLALVELRATAWASGDSRENHTVRVDAGVHLRQLPESTRH